MAAVVVPGKEAVMIENMAQPDPAWANACPYACGLAEFSPPVSTTHFVFYTRGDRATQHPKSFALQHKSGSH